MFDCNYEDDCLRECHEEVDGSWVCHGGRGRLKKP